MMRLLEVVEALRGETVKRLNELESRISEVSGRKELARLMELIYQLTVAVCLSYYLLMLAQSPQPVIHEFEEEFMKLLKAWKKVIEGNKELFGVVDWPIIQDGTEVILRAARRVGLPFGTIASRVVEVMGGDAEKFLSEASIAEIYGMINLAEWRRMIGK